MEFDKSRVYTSLNADELKAGDKVIVADDLATLRDFVLGIDTDPWYGIITEILPDKVAKRFVTEGDIVRNLAYLVERKENCTNCGCRDRYSICKYEKPNPPEMTKCDNWRPKTTEKKYRPFRDTDELIKVWGEKEKKAWGYNWLDNKQPMPLIWVRNKVQRDSVGLIVGFDNEGVEIARQYAGWITLFNCFEFFDGTPCGVEE